MTDTIAFYRPPWLEYWVDDADTGDYLPIIQIFGVQRRCSASFRRRDNHSIPKGDLGDLGNF